MTLYFRKGRYRNPRTDELFVPFIRLVVQRTGRNIATVIGNSLLWYQIAASPRFLRHAMRYAVTTPEQVVNPARAFDANYDDWVLDGLGYEVKEEKGDGVEVAASTE